MLEVQARDGAARLSTLTIGQRLLHTPGIFWVASELPEGRPDWEPILDRAPSPRTVLVNTFRFTDAAPSAGPGQLLLQRRLLPTASMQQGKPTLETLQDRVVAMAGARDLFRNPRRLVPALVHARTEATYRRALYSPGLGEPNHLAVLAYAGVDLFDAVPLSLAAAERRFLTESGSYPAEALGDPMCSCPICSEAAPADQDERALRTHNHHAARAELGAVRNAIREGRLRELVEARVRSHPELTALLRRLDQQYEYFEERVPVQRARPLHASTKESLRRAECERFRRRVEARWIPPPEPAILLLLPCSHRKPYATSRTHRAIGDAVRASGARGLVQEAIVTSPLGLVPRELELCYPAAHYDVPVTGEWDPEEGAMIRGLLASLLRRQTYASIVAHLPRHTFDLVRDALPESAISTVEGEDATSPAALTQLQQTLSQEGHGLRPVPPPARLKSQLCALATYQFGLAAAQALFHDAQARGRWPHPRLVADDVQLAMVPPERGLLSLTLPGGERLLPGKEFSVEIDDFPVKGSVFAVGIKTADPQIRQGDEVVVHHAGRIRGVGVALMNGIEMIQQKRGEAVRVRHHA